MARRHKPRVADWRPEPKLTSYHHKPVGSSIKQTPRTTPVGGDNPFYSEGLMDAKRSGARLSKSVCSGRAFSGHPPAEEVASDRRMQAAERKYQRTVDDLGSLQRRIDVGLALLDRKHNRRK